MKKSLALTTDIVFCFYLGERNLVLNGFWFFLLMGTITYMALGRVYIRKSFFGMTPLIENTLIIGVDSSTRLA